MVDTEHREALETLFMLVKGKQPTPHQIEHLTGLLDRFPVSVTLPAQTNQGDPYGNAFMSKVFKDQHCSHKKKAS